MYRFFCFVYLNIICLTFVWPCDDNEKGYKNVQLNLITNELTFLPKEIVNLTELIEFDSFDQENRRGTSTNRRRLFR